MCRRHRERKKKKEKKGGKRGEREEKKEDQWHVSPGQQIQLARFFFFS